MAQVCDVGGSGLLVGFVGRASPAELGSARLIGSLFGDDAIPRCRATVSVV